MSSLWTPGGEHRVERAPTATPGEPAAAGKAARAEPVRTEAVGGPEDQPAARDELAALERELVETPAADVVANHCYGLFQLAALHLGQRPPRLDDARIAIDAFAAILDSLGERLGPATATLRDALAQIRLAFVQISAGERPPADGAPAG